MAREGLIRGEWIKNELEIRLGILFWLGVKKIYMVYIWIFKWVVSQKNPCQNKIQIHSTVFWFPVSEKWGQFLGIKDELHQIFFIIITFENVKNNPHIGPLIKIRGSKMILAEQALRWAQRKFYLMQFWLRILTFKIDFFSVFSKKSKSGHFVLQISPWKQYPQKKWSTPRESQCKMQQNCRLRFLIFETLSQRFFTTMFLIIKKNIFSDFMIRIFIFGGL